MTTPSPTLLPFNDKEYWKEVRDAFFSFVVLFNQVDRAYALYKNLESYIRGRGRQSEEKDDLLSEQKRVLIYAESIAIPMLDREEIVRFFSEHFAEGFVVNIDYIEKIKAKLVAIIEYEERNEFREQIYRAILTNESSLVDKPIENIMTKEKLKRVKEFLLDYVRANGLDRVDSVKREQFMIKEYNFESLSEPDQIKIKGLFDFFEYLKLNSWELEADEEPFIIIDDGGLKVFKGKEVEDINKSKAANIVDDMIKLGILHGDGKTSEDMATNQEVLSKTWADFEADENFREIEKVRRGMTKDGIQIDKIKSQMYEAVNSGKTADFVGRFAVIAQSAKIRESFKDDERYISFWKKHLEHHWEEMKDELGIKNYELGKILEEFIKDPAAPNQIANFVREVLVKKMNISEEESAMIGAYLSNISRSAGEEEYGKLAYADLKEGKFKWNLS